MDNLLTIENLKVDFRQGSKVARAVRGVSVSVREGEVLGIVGESGSGKSVTMKAVMGLLPRGAEVSADALSLHGVDLAGMDEASLRQVRGRITAMIFQDPMTSLNPLLRVERHLTDVLRRSSSGRNLRNQALELMRRVGIPSPEERITQYPHELSGGMRQRVLIAMALACKPRLLIADEPTTALDVTIQAQILDLIKSLQALEKMAVILITHDLGVVARMCDRVAVMYAGLIMEESPIDDLFESPLHPYTNALMHALPAVTAERQEHRRLSNIKGSPPSAMHLPVGCPFEPRCDYARSDCAATVPQLMDRGGGRKVRCLYAREVIS